MYINDKFTFIISYFIIKIYLGLYTTINFVNVYSIYFYIVFNDIKWYFLTLDKKSSYNLNIAFNIFK